MWNQLIKWVNRIFTALIIFFLVEGAYIYTLGEEAVQPVIIEHPVQAPVTSFSPKEKNYDSLGSRALELEYNAPRMRVPDLRPFLNYRGHNLRPDAKDAGILFFSLGSSPDAPLFQVNTGIKQYLILDPKSTTSFTLSPQNKPTNLWFEPEIKGSQVLVHVRIQDESGVIGDEPKDRANFTLTEKANVNEAKGFMIGNQRVDVTLFSRLKGKWHGVDQFLRDHGGAEYENFQGKQRIGFGEGEESYAIYLGKGDIMIWKNQKWEVPQDSEDTSPYPLARINKIEDRVMGIEIFDVSGKIKVNLNLLKLQEAPQNQMKLDQDFQFAGARSKVHSMFKINNKREIVGVGDWFVNASDGWKKLKSAKEIDAYIRGQITGALLIIDQIEKDNEEAWFAATFYSPSRSASELVKLPLRTSGLEKKEVAPRPSEVIDVESIPRGQKKLISNF